MSRADEPAPRGDAGPLRIDAVVASQPELGPTPPDGGYGWVVLAAAVLVQITVPSVTVAYGVLVLYGNLQNEYEENETFYLWGGGAMPMVPIGALVFSLLTTSWSKTLVSVAHRPRAVAVSGVCLVAAGVLLSSVGVDSEADALVFNVFSGMLVGLGSSLTNQQSETLLQHYFSKRRPLVKAVHKTSVLVGSIIMSIVMGTLLTRFEEAHALLIYSGIMLQNCVVLLAFTRPTYIVAPLQQMYKSLKEDEDDEDEEIYSSQNGASSSRQNQTGESNDRHESAAGIDNPFHEDEDEEVIGTFHAEDTVREVVQQPNTTRLDASVRPYVIDVRDDFDRQPDSLYRETTVANGDAAVTNIFTFEPTPPTVGTARRTEHVKKNVFVLMAALRDLRFYVHTYVDLNAKLSALVLGLLFPAYASQQMPGMDFTGVVGLVVVVYLGAACLNVVTAFLPTTASRRFFAGVFSLLSFVGLIVIAESNTKTWLIPSGILASFAIHALYIVQTPIYEDVQIEQEAYVISTVSNTVIAVVVCLVTMIGNYEYVRYFKIAGMMHMFSPILLAIVRRSP